MFEQESPTPISYSEY